MTNKNSKMIELLNSFSPSEHNRLIADSIEWESIGEAFEEWMNIYAIRSHAPLPPERAVSVFYAALQAAYAKGWERVRREAVMSMKWRVGDE